MPGYQVLIPVAIKVRRNYTLRSRGVRGNQTRRPELHGKRRGQIQQKETGANRQERTGTRQCRGEHTAEANDATCAMHR
jgi:hypothetical protein